jgi:hypothetical protein
MKMTALFYQIQREIATKLGLSDATNVTLLVYHSGTSTKVRLPAPGTDQLDFCPPEKTGDVIGEGSNLDEALENVCSSYWLAESQTLTPNALRERKNHSLQ